MKILPMESAPVTKEDWIRKAARLSLKFLCVEILGFKDWSGVHDELEQFLKRSGKRKHIELARGHLKSSIVTKAWSIQQVLINPNLRILIANAVWDNSRKFLRSIQKYIGPGSLLSGYFGNFMSEHWNQDECTVRQRSVILDAPTWATTGIEKEQTSQHYDVIIADDLVARDNVMTVEQREKVELYYKDLFDLLEPDGTIVVIGTRWHQDDLYSKILEETKTDASGGGTGWDSFIRTAYTTDEKTDVIFPEKFSLAHLEQLRRTKGPYEFAAQYLNNPIDESAAPFKKSWIKRYLPGTPHPASLYLTVDPGLSVQRDADYSGLVVAGQFSSRVIRVVDYVRKRLAPRDLVQEIFLLVEKWNLHRVGIETFAFQKTLKYDVQAEQRRRNQYFSIDELGSRRGGREPPVTKEARISRLQPFFEQGLIELRGDMQALEDEILSFPRGKYDDLLDALSYQLDYLVPSVDRIAVPGIIPGSYRDVLQKTWAHQGGDLYAKFMSDLKEHPETPYVP